MDTAADAVDDTEKKNWNYNILFPAIWYFEFPTI